MAEKKINWLLILQGWAMLWVVIGHSTVGTPGEGPAWENMLYHFAYSFHMPLFMLVSGWLFYLTRIKKLEYNPNWGGQKWTYLAIIKDKALRLLLPGMVFSVVALVVKLAFPGEMSRQIDFSVEDLVHAYLYPYDNPMRELWFIATLFWLMMLVPLWKWMLSASNRLRHQLLKKWGMVFLLTLLYFWHPEIELLCIGKVFSHAIWFYLGLLISEEEIVEKYMAKHPWIVSLCGIAIYMIGRYADPFVSTVGCVTFSFGLALILDKYLPKTFFSFRNYTYQIFLMGIFVQIAVKIAYRHVTMPYALAFIFCILMGLYVPVMVSKIIERINWKPLSLCVGLK